MTACYLRHIDAALARTRAELGPISILIDNAGKAPFSPFLKIDQGAFEDVLRVNVIGAFLCSQAVLPDMLAAKRGRIVNITSSITHDGVGTMAHYAASKSGLVASCGPAQPGGNRCRHAGETLGPRRGSRRRLRLSRV